MKRKKQKDLSLDKEIVVALNSDEMYMAKGGGIRDWLDEFKLTSIYCTGLGCVVVMQTKGNCDVPTVGNDTGVCPSKSGGALCCGIA